MLARLVKSALIAGLLVIAVLGGLGLRLVQWAHAKVDMPGEVIFEFKPGTSLSILARDLAAQGIISSATYFNLWVRAAGNYQRYQAGTYRFTGQVAPDEAIDSILRGDVYNPVVLSITIPEGFRLREVIERLAANGVGHIAELTKLVSDPAFLQSQNIKSTNVEGYVYPATYAFHKIPTPAAAFETMIKTFWQHLPKNYEKNVNAMGLTLNQAVTFASLIELETRSDAEKSLISEVIWRRLKDKVPLAIDAAVIYGVTDYTGDLTWAHLADAKNPYNTRIHLGLPPTPIGAPGQKSLEAVLTPSNFGYYYYVLIPGEGRHHFSRTLQEHNLHVKKLINGMKRDKAKSLP